MVLMASAVYPCSAVRVAQSTFSDVRIRGRRSSWPESGLSRAAVVLPYPCEKTY